MGERVRQSNFELLRLVAIFMVLVVHADYYALGAPTLSELQIAPIATITRIGIEYGGLCCVDLFILISGYFRIRASVYSILKFLFIIFFWSLARLVYNPYDWMSVFNPFSFWFVRAYLGLVLLSPILNAFIEKVDRSSLGRYLAVFYALQTVFGVVCAIWTDFARGYSLLSFMGLYLLGAFLKVSENRLSWFSKSKCLLFYLLSIFIGISCAVVGLFVCSRIAPTWSRVVRHLVDSVGFYNSPLIIASAVSLFLLFKQFKIESELVNRLAKSVFAVYIMHMSPYFSLMINQTYQNTNGVVALIVILVELIGVFAVIALVDSLRIWIWQKLTSLKRNHG